MAIYGERFKKMEDIESLYKRLMDDIYVFFAYRGKNEALVIFSSEDKYYVNYSKEGNHVWAPVCIEDPKNINWEEIPVEGNTVKASITTYFRRFSIYEDLLAATYIDNEISPVRLNTDLYKISAIFVSHVKQLGKSAVDAELINVQTVTALFRTIIALRFTLDKSEGEVAMFMLGGVVATGLVSTQSILNLPGGGFISTYNRITRH